MIQRVTWSTEPVTVRQAKYMRAALIAQKQDMVDWDSQILLLVSRSNGQLTADQLLDISTTEFSQMVQDCCEAMPKIQPDDGMEQWRRLMS